MTRIALRLSLLSVAVFVFPGCLELALIQALQRDDDGPVYADDTYDESWDTATPEPYYEASNLDVRSASLAGDMGSVHDIADEAPTTDGYDYGGYSTLNIHARGSNGAAMAIVQVEGGLGHADLAPGAHLEFGDDYYSTEGGLYMYVVGCSGPEEGMWDYDESAGSLVVDVSATPEGTEVLDFTATFNDGHTVVGSAELGALQAQ